ncbi:MAG: ATP-binding protein [Sulfurovum sp.]
MKSKKSYILLNITIFFLFFLSALFIDYNSKKNISTLLTSNLKLSTMQYRSVMNHYNILADNVKNIVINSPKVIDIFKNAKDANISQRAKIRNKLKITLQQKYNYLIELGFKQLHFHLPNNISFLRMHRPSKFGDDLSDIRYSVKSVNQTLKPISGFEAGRVVHGFRFVYPLFDKKGNHIGSVEASISSKAFKDILLDTFFSDVHFLIKKSIVNKKIWKSEKLKFYINSAELPQYYTEKSQDNKHLTKIKKNRDYTKKIKKYILEDIAFSLYNDINNNIVSFLPIKNIKDKETVAYFVIYSKAKEITGILFMAKIFNIFLIFIFIIIIYFIRREYIDIQLRKKIEKELAELNKNLSDRVEIEIQKSRDKDKKLIEHSRLAQMGEMLSMIAHQWRQPLSAISSTAVGLEIKADLNKIDNAFVIKQAQNISKYSQYLSQTINDFRDFFKSDKKKSITSFKEILYSVLNIVEVSITNKNIDIIKKCNNQESFNTYSNELKQVILNLLKNAEDVLIERNIENPYIKITTYKRDDKYIMEIKDNGGGVPKDIEKKIFDPYFSTKLEKNGTGLGLYMSKTIIEEHCKGELKFINSKKGAIFLIVLGECIV